MWEMVRTTKINKQVILKKQKKKTSMEVWGEKNYFQLWYLNKKSIKRSNLIKEIISGLGLQRFMELHYL